MLESRLAAVVVVWALVGVGLAETEERLDAVVVAELEVLADLPVRRGEEEEEAMANIVKERRTDG